VRVARPADRVFTRVAAALTVLAGPALGALLMGSLGAMAGGVLGLAGAYGLYRLGARRGLRRRAVLARPFPEAWRRILLDRYDHYDRLPDALRARFEDDLRLFLAEARITGVGAEATEERRLLVAASAVTLSLGWPDYEWDQLTEVLLYPQDFDRDYSFEEPKLAGLAHPWGTVILSVPALDESFADPDDAYHVGLHEFAHLLNLDRTEFNGIPSGLARERVGEWQRLAQAEMERLRRGRSVLDDYGAEDPREFMAVAVEAFFEAPLAVRKEHGQLYDILSDYFRQDPAAWDDERGLTLDP
jgi:MtfA peptidase